MADCLIALGSNLGDRAAALDCAVQLLRSHPRIDGVTVSRRFETAPVGGPQGQPAFLNAAARLQTTLPPQELLALLHDIEAQLGRQRETRRWQARTLDLDLLLYDQQVIHTPELQVPHPRLALRRFVLEPAAEVAPEMLHPQFGWSVARLLEHLATALPYVAIAGVPGTGKSALARAASHSTGMQWIADPPHDPPQKATAAEEDILVARRLALSAAKLSPMENGAVSDFWLSQSLAYLKLRLAAGQHGAAQQGAVEQGNARQDEEQQLERLADQIEAAEGETLSPKLLVLLDLPEESAATSGDGARLASEFRRLATRCGRGPFLVLEAARPDVAREELLAAVEAMR